MNINTKRFLALCATLLVITLFFVIYPAHMPGLAADTRPHPPLPQATPPAASQELLVVKKALDMGDRYILMGEFRSDLAQAALPAGGSTGASETLFKDANGRAIGYGLPADSIDALWPPIDPGAQSWAYQIDKGFAAPLTMISTLTLVRPPGKTEFDFDAGGNPQPGQVWQLNKDFDIDGHIIRLVSITLNTSQGYFFQLQSDDPTITGLTVEIIGHPSISMASSAGEDKSRTPVWQGTFELDYHLALLLPKGMLEVVISSTEAVSESRTYQLKWSPEPVDAEPFITPLPYTRP